MEEAQQVQEKKTEEKKEEKPKVAPAKKVETKTENKAEVLASTPENLEKVAKSVKDKLAAKKQDAATASTKEPAKEKVEYVLQRKAVIPLSTAYAKPAKKRARKAILLIRAYAARHTKTTEDKVKIDEKLASFVNARGAKHPP